MKLFDYIVYQSAALRSDRWIDDSALNHAVIKNTPPGCIFIGPSMLKLPHGTVAEWLRSGLQNRVHRFNSGRCLHLLVYLSFT